jgi:hypothetical protein
LLAPKAKWRSQIVPVSSNAPNSAGCPGCVVKKGKKDPQGKKSENPGKGHPRNYAWAELMKRVWGFDVLRCDRCGSRMRILCAINAPEAIRKILDCLGLPSKPPPIFSAVLDRASD